MRQVVTYKKCSFMRGSNWKALTLLWIGGRLRHVIAYGYIAFIDLTKAFNLVIRKGLFTLLQTMGCPPKLLRMITSFVRSTSDPFPIKSWVKQGCVLASTLCGMFFFLLLSYAFTQKKWMVCTFTPEAMETLHVSEQSLKFRKYW